MNKPNRYRTMCAASLLLALTLLLCACLSACGGASSGTKDNGCLTVVCTNYAAFDLAREIVTGGGTIPDTTSVQLYMLGRPGQDMHSYEPTAADIIEIGGADILICLGTESWLDAAIKASGNKDLIRVAMTEVCDTLPEPITEGGHDHDHDHDHAEDGAVCVSEGDEHVWLSLANARRIAEAITNAACEAVPAESALWKGQSNALQVKLMELEREYALMVMNAARREILIADRHPFGYLVHELGLTCYAAFPGCSSETSASFATQTALIEKVRELNLPYIYVMEGSNASVARAVADATGAEILTLQSLQVVTDYDTSYLAVMRDNLEALRRGLN